MVEIVPPDERTCTRCGRRDRWDGERGTWVATDEPGRPHCLHEWDINGNYRPIAE